MTAGRAQRRTVGGDAASRDQQPVDPLPPDGRRRRNRLRSRARRRDRAYRCNWRGRIVPDQFGRVHVLFLAELGARPLQAEVAADLHHLAGITVQLAVPPDFSDQPELHAEAVATVAHFKAEGSRQRRFVADRDRQPDRAAGFKDVARYGLSHRKFQRSGRESGQTERQQESPLRLFQFSLPGCSFSSDHLEGSSVEAGGVIDKSRFPRCVLPGSTRSVCEAFPASAA